MIELDDNDDDDDEDNDDDEDDYTSLNQTRHSAVMLCDLQCRLRKVNYYRRRQTLSTMISYFQIFLLLNIIILWATFSTKTIKSFSTMTMTFCLLIATIVQPSKTYNLGSTLTHHFHPILTTMTMTMTRLFPLLWFLQILQLQFPTLALQIMRATGLKLFSCSADNALLLDLDDNHKEGNEKSRRIHQRRYYKWTIHNNKRDIQRLKDFPWTVESFYKSSLVL